METWMNIKSGGGLEMARLIFTKGGPVMWPLLLCSLLSMTITLERILFWWRQRMTALREEMLDAALRQVESGEFEQAVQALLLHPFAATRMLASGLKHREYSLEDSLEVAAGDEIARMKRGLTVLDTIVTMAPLLGILGTVTGIIRSFHILGGGEAPDPTAVISGLAEALGTTAAGLIIAMATLVPYNAMISRVQREARRLEQVGGRAVVAYKRGLAHAADNRV